jgi:hypothetical protein
MTIRTGLGGQGGKRQEEARRKEGKVRRERGRVGGGEEKERIESETKKKH